LIREPWTLELSKQAIGRAGEFQAAAVFEQHGIVTTHVDVYGVDLWCQTPSGRRVTVQVKSTLGLGSTESDRAPRYFFQLRPNNASRTADVYCFVTLDTGLLRLFSTVEVSATTKKALSASQLTQEAMEADLKRYLY